MESHTWLADLAVEMAAKLNKSGEYTAKPETAIQDQSSGVSGIGDATEQAQKIDEPSDPARKPDGVAVVGGVPVTESASSGPSVKADSEGEIPLRSVPSILKASAAMPGIQLLAKASAPSRSRPSLLQKAANQPGMPAVSNPALGAPMLQGSLLPTYPYGNPYLNPYGLRSPYGGMPYGGMPYGGMPYGGMPYGGMPYGGMPYNPVAANLATTAMQSGINTNAAESANRVRDLQQSFDDAQSRNRQMLQSLQRGTGSPVSQMQLEQSLNELHEAAAATGASSGRAVTKVVDPVHGTQNVRFGHDGSRFILPPFNVFGSVTEQPGLWAWMMGHRTTDAWQRYQRALQNHRNLANRYQQWLSDQRQQGDELRQGPFSVASTSSRLQRAQLQEEADFQRRRDAQFNVSQTQQDALRGYLGNPLPQQSLPSSQGASTPTHQPQIGMPKTSAASPPPVPPSAGDARKLFARVIANTIMQTGIGGLAGGVYDVANYDATKPLDLAGLRRGLQTGLVVGLGGETGSLSGRGLNLASGSPPSLATRLAGRAVGSMAGLAASNKLGDPLQ